MIAATIITLRFRARKAITQSMDFVCVSVINRDDVAGAVDRF